MEQRLQQSLNIIKTLPFTNKTEYANDEDFYRIRLLFDGGWLLIVSIYKEHPSLCNYSIYENKELVEADCINVNEMIERFKNVIET